MKVRYKLIIVVLLLWIGMSYEGTRNTPQMTRTRQDMTLDERIEAYELGLTNEVDFDDHYIRNGISETAHQGNLVARTGRNIGNALQTFVREVLRGIVRFFDGVIS